MSTHFLRGRKNNWICHRRLDCYASDLCDVKENRLIASIAKPFWQSMCTNHSPLLSPLPNYILGCPTVHFVYSRDDVQLSPRPYLSLKKWEQKYQIMWLENANRPAHPNQTSTSRFFATCHSDIFKRIITFLISPLYRWAYIFIFTTILCSFWVTQFFTIKTNNKNIKIYKTGENE